MDEVNSIKREFVIYVSIISLIGFFGVSLVMMAIMKKILIKPVQQATDMMIEMSKGHLHSRISTDSKDEIGMMARSIIIFLTLCKAFLCLCIKLPTVI
jgi:nitrate/nitrite-specific signal transduction histidine kinase